MLTYIGTKTVKAHPMTRGEYNAYRDWKAPDGEDQTVEGYLVEYPPMPGEEPNHQDHEGYITWSPATAFEASYKIAGTWQQRLFIEGRQLADKLHALKAFMETDAFDVLPVIEKDALDRQVQHMAAYLGVLNERFKRAPLPEVEVNDGDPANPEIDGPAAEVLENNPQQDPATLDGDAEK